jgi:hypothetical protein
VVPDIDESGEDYLYPGAWFVALDLPRHAVKALQGEGEVA